MTKRIRSAAGVTGLAAMFLAFFGSGIAAADDYAGQTYSDASGAIGKAGQTAVIAGTVGGLLSQGDCIVTRSQQADWLKGNNFSPVTDTVLLWLNCNAKLATAGTPGNSLASPEGRAEKAAEDQKAARAAQQSTAPSG